MAAGVVEFPSGVVVPGMVVPGVAGPGVVVPGPASAGPGVVVRGGTLIRLILTTILISRFHAYPKNVSHFY